MRKWTAAALAFSLFGLWASVAPARADGELKMGDPAPKLAVKDWVQGEPVTGFEKGKVYVVEFWATWCGPCRTTIPHLSELAKSHKDVTFIGVSVWEDDPSQVKPFVKEMGDKMTYKVATDDVPKDGAAADGQMAKTWMEAAGQDGIPAAFIVDKDSKIAWIGHPTEMDKVLDKVIDGTYDVKTAMEEAKKEDDARSKVAGMAKKLQDALQAGEPKKAVEAIDEIIAAMPAAESQLSIQKYLLLLTQMEDVKGAVAYAEEVSGRLKDSDPGKPMALNAFAWTMIDPEGPPIEKPDYAFALKAATEASKLTKDADPAILDTLGLALFKNGKVQEAIKIQEKAVAAAKEQGLEDDADIKARLEEFKSKKN